MSKSGKNAFLYFLDDFRIQNPNRRQSELFREAGQEWRQMSTNAKLKYYSLAKPPRTAGGDDPQGCVSIEDQQPQDAIVDVMKRGAPLRDGNFLERRGRKIPAEEQKRQLMFMHLKTIAITIIVCMTTYFICRFY